MFSGMRNQTEFALVDGKLVFGGDDTDPKSAPGTVVGIIASGIYVGRPPGQSVRRVAFMLAGGASAREILGAGGTFIAWDDVVSAEWTDEAHTVELVHRDGAKSRTVSMTLDDDVDAGSVFTEIAARVREVAPESTRPASTLGAIFRSLGCLGLVALLLAIMFGVQAMDPLLSSGSHVRGKGAILLLLGAFVQTIGHVGTAVVGAALLAYVIYRFVRFLAKRPQVHCVSKVAS
jgi:hypothetical protein